MDEDLEPAVSLPPELDAYAHNFALQAALNALQGRLYHPVTPIEPATAAATMAVIGRQLETASSPEEARRRICEYFWVLRQLIWPLVSPESCNVISELITMFVDLNRGKVPLAFQPAETGKAGSN